MTRTELCLGTLKKTHVVSVIRIHSDIDLSPTMEALYQGGVKVIEITATTPGYTKNIARIREVFSDKQDCFVGAGTVLSMRQLEEAVAAGADFIVSPIFDERIVATCTGKNVPVMPGAMTPTEIYRAWTAGASVVKAFPGGVCTPGFFADMKGPFPEIPLMPTGNVNVHTAPEYIRAGAVAVGIGKALAGEAAIISGDWNTIEQHAKEYISLLAGL